MIARKFGIVLLNRHEGTQAALLLYNENCMQRKPQNLTPSQALTKLQRYCAYQDRCHQEVRRKLVLLGVRGDDLENIIADLIQDNFLDEERFARSYVRGKYTLKRWGRLKILKELRQKNISPYCLKKGMTEIEDDIYNDNLRHLAERKLAELTTEDKYKRWQKTSQYLWNKGYENELITPLLQELIHQ